MAKAAARQRRTVTPIADDDNFLEQLVASVQRIEAGLREIQETGNTIAGRLESVERVTRTIDLELQLAKERGASAPPPAPGGART